MESKKAEMESKKAELKSKEELERAIQLVESQREVLGDEVVEASLTGLYLQLKALQKQQSQSPQRKQVTILFADISGFTALSETLDHEEVHQIVNGLWQKLDPIIQNLGGKIDKHIGDAVMAIFGSENVQEDDPERAIDAALAIQKKTTAYLQKQRQSNPDFPTLQIRIGIHTGLVSLGNVGKTQEYTAMGDTVNLASRLEQAAPVGEILISQQVYSHVLGSFSLQCLEPIQVKGRKNPLQTYLVQRRRPRAFRLPIRRVEGIETPIVGRKKEMLQLQHSLESVLEKQELQMVTLIGEAGLGKSRLLYEFEKWAGLHPKILRLFKGRAHQQSLKTPYAMMRDLFEFRFAIQEVEKSEKKKEKLIQGITEFMGKEGEKTAHLIGHLLGVSFTNSPHLQGIIDSPQQIQQQAFYHTVLLLEKMSHKNSTGGLLFLLEDLHWADQGSLDWVVYLIRKSAQLPLFLVATARPEFLKQRPSWGKNQREHHILSLSHLKRKDSDQLIQSILCNLSEIPPSFLKLLIEKSEGNPFCIEELIKMFINDGVILKGEKEWQLNLSRLSHLKVPSTLTGVLQARFDSLSPQEKEVLQAASSIGRVFWNQTVSFTITKNQDVNEILHSLHQKEMLFLREHSIFYQSQEYVFKHALLQVVIYETVLKSQRKIYHAKIAEWLSQQNSTWVSEESNIIAEHYEFAEQREEAAFWYTQAGKNSKKTYATQEAIEFFEQALALFPKRDSPSVEQMDCYSEISEVLNWQAQYKQGRVYALQLLQLAKQAKDITQQGRAWNHLSLFYKREGDHIKSLHYAQETETLFQREGDFPIQKEYIVSLIQKAQALQKLGKLQAALSTCQQALKLCIQLCDQPNTVSLYTIIGSIYNLLGNWKQASDYYETSIKLAEKLGDQKRLMVNLLNLGELQRKLGNYQKALVLSQKSSLLNQEIGLRGPRILLCNNIAGAKLGLQQYKIAEQELLQAITMFEKLSNWFGTSETYSFLAQAYLGQGELEQSLQAGQKALKEGKETQDPYHLGVAWKILGCIASQSPELILIQNQEVSSSDCFANSQDIYHKAGIQLEQAKTLRCWACAEWQQGNEAKAKELWQKAKTIFTKLEASLHLEKMETWPPTNILLLI